MKVLLAGCSFAQPLQSIIEKQIPGSQVINVAKAAAGNKYIADSVITSTLEHDFDLIYVSWSGWSRVDIPVHESALFNDWVYQADLQDKTYIFSGGSGGWDYHNHQFINLLFTNYHKFVDHCQLHHNSLLEIIKTQSYLKQLGKPFYFATMINQFTSAPDQMVEHTCEYGGTRYPENQALIDAIDFSNWVFGDNQQGIHETIKNLNMLDTDNFHPSQQGYEYWIDLLCARLKKDKIL